jgi:hypothetical protein
MGHNVAHVVEKNFLMVFKGQLIFRKWLKSTFKDQHLFQNYQLIAINLFVIETG